MNQTSEGYISSAINECEKIQSEKNPNCGPYLCALNKIYVLFSLLNDHKQHGKADRLNLDYVQKERKNLHFITIIMCSCSILEL